ncbi:hypothetical protein VKT23_017581 [Stygiomarasmius scandens]|uniref:Uncharacterized protein n=1 Tax=Marasmiellus scandens TaxID=2682957 RepID=A0ABR1IVX5_9AGAR
MKGLILTHMGLRTEGIDLVKKGMRLDLTSHIVWHVFGLIQKGEKDYAGALKSYTQALKFDKDNMNILRDAAQLQTQLGLYDGLVETRHTLLKLRPTLRQHWTALAVAYYLSGNLQQAKNVLEKYESTLKNIPDYDNDHSETLLFHIRVLYNLGLYTEAISLLDTNAKARAIVDKTAIMQYRAQLLSASDSSEAADAWRVCIEHNSENVEYYEGYLKEKKKSEEDSLQVLTSLSTTLPRASVPKRLALSLAPVSDGTFSSLAKPYILSGLQKGIPSLFVDLKGLYTDIAKMQAIQDIVEAELSSPSGEADPSTYIWTLYFLSQHYSFLSNQSTALKHITTAIAHTPTLPDLHVLHGKILKRSGDLYGAARAINLARLLDGQDRFLNTKTGKYLLRAGLVEEAGSKDKGVLGVFTKKDAPSPAADLEDMQSLLYLLEEADAHQRNFDLSFLTGAQGQELGMALKKYLAVQKIFSEIQDDQYDFHGYCLRKFTISVYLDLLAYEQTLPLHPSSIKSAIAASRIFLSVYDDPELRSGSSKRRVKGGVGKNGAGAGEAGAGPQLTDAEKKAKKKAKKAAAQAQKKEKEKEKEEGKDGKKVAAAQNNNEDKGLEPPTPPDDDLDGKKVLGCEDPLERAAKLLGPISKLLLARYKADGEKGDAKEKKPKHKWTKGYGEVEFWTTVYDVAIRRKKPLQAIQALVQAHTIDPEHPEVHLRVVHAAHYHLTTSSSDTSVTSSTFADQLSSLLPPSSSGSLEALSTYNSTFLQQHSSSPKTVLACAKATQLLDAPRAEVEDTVLGLLTPEPESKPEHGLDIETALEALVFLHSLSFSSQDQETEALERFRTTCSETLFPLSTIFKTIEEQKKMRQELTEWIGAAPGAAFGSESGGDGEVVTAE